MRTLKVSENFSLETNSNAITIGSFDGVHVGHQKVIRTTNKLAQKINGASVVVTFTPHPLSIVDPVNAPKLLSTDQEKEKLIASLNIDYLLFLTFDDHLARLSPYDFIKNIIVEKLKSSAIVVGYDHGFGKSRSGDIELLKDLSDEYNFGVETVTPKLVDNEIVSSTYIRERIQRNEWEEIPKMLGRYYSFSGKVVYGAQRGNFLDFPTANLEIENSSKLIPDDGVYAVWIKWKSKIYSGAMNIGTNPTFGNNKRTIEVFILDFSENIYGENLEVLVIEKIRSEVRFSGIKELRGQIQKDVHIIRKVLERSVKF